MSVSGARIRAACGPWMAISAYSAVWSSHLRVVPGGAVAERRGHHGGVGRVRDDQVLGLAQPVHDEVVEDPPVRSADHGVPGAARGQRGQAADQGVVQRGGRPGPGHRDLTHVGQVEQPGGVADRLMLGDLAGVPERHQPARERRHGGAQALVDRAQRRGPRRSRFRRAHRIASMPWSLAGATVAPAWARPAYRASAGHPPAPASACLLLSCETARRPVHAGLQARTADITGSGTRRGLGGVADAGVIVTALGQVAAHRTPLCFLACPQGSRCGGAFRR